jgi:patatin-like phospholipase/acyl hydrolase
MRGLIPALVIEELERRLAEATGTRRALTDYFHLLAGTSTGGLIALGLTAPGAEREDAPRMDGAALVRLYRERGPAIFRRSALHRLRTLDGWIGPKRTVAALRVAVEEEIGPATLRSALRDLVVTAYDMTTLEPRFFKRWRAREDPRATIRSSTPPSPRRPHPPTFRLMPWPAVHWWTGACSLRTRRWPRSRRR